MSEAQGAERTSPEAAMESLALWLNLQDGEELPLSRLAQQSGLAWATASKYVSLIERLQGLLPRCERTERGRVRVLQCAKAMRPILDDKASATALALMLQSRRGGKVEISDLTERLHDGLHELRELGGIEDDCTLTPAGWVVATDAYEQAFSREPPRTVVARREVTFEPTSGRVWATVGEADLVTELPEAAVVACGPLAQRRYTQSEYSPLPSMTMTDAAANAAAGA